MPSRLCNNSVPQRIIPCRFQSFDCHFRQITNWETSSDIQKSHFMLVNSPNLHAFPGQFDSLAKTRRSMLPRSTMEMYSFKFDSHLANLMHSIMDHIISFKIIAKLARKRCGKIIRGLLLDSNSPKDIHLRSILLNFDQLINRISCSSFDSLPSCPDEILLIFYRIRINNIFNRNSWLKTGLNLGPWSTVHSCTLTSQILDQLLSGIWFYGVMGLYPR